VPGAAAAQTNEDLLRELRELREELRGLLLDRSELDGKRLALLREVMSSLTRAAVVWNPRNEANRHNMASLEVPAKILGIQLESADLGNLTCDDVHRAGFLVAGRSAVETVQDSSSLRAGRARLADCDGSRLALDSSRHMT
jgi:hypothetical protein